MEVNSSKKKIWIVKPAERSNRGQGIFLATSIHEIRNKIDKKGKYIIQKYMKNIFLYQRRKFDIRTFLLAVTYGDQTKFFWYK